MKRLLAWIFPSRRSAALCRDAAAKYSGIWSPAWSEDAAADLQKFLHTPTGAILRLRLQAMVAQVCVAGCEDSAHTVHSAGVGAGWNEAVRKLLEMSEPKRFSTITATPAETGEHKEKDGQPPEGEEELMERWSP